MPREIVLLMNKKNRGFTLIEIIVVIAIISVLAAIAIPAIAKYMDNSKARTNVTNAKTIYEAACAYFAGNQNALDSDLSTSALADTHILITTMYLDKAPLTAERNTYAVTSAAKVVSVTWKAETGLAAENPAGIKPAIGDTLIYPAP